MTDIYKDSAGDALEVSFHVHEPDPFLNSYDEQLQSDCIAIEANSVAIPVNQVPEVVLALIKEAGLDGHGTFPVDVEWAQIVQSIESYVDEKQKHARVRESYDEIAVQLFETVNSFEELTESNKDIVRSLATRVIGFSVINIVPDAQPFTRQYIFPKKEDAIEAAISTSTQLHSDQDHAVYFKVVRVFS